MKAKSDKSSSKIKKAISFVYKKLCSALFPPKIKCLVCGEDLPQVQDVEFCERCNNLINYINENHACQKCGAKITGQGKFCLNCMNTKRVFTMARSVAEFDGVVQQLIHNFKFNAKPYISATLGTLMAQKFLETKWQIDCISYVPITKERLGERGYNQAKLLAEQISLLVGIPVVEILSKTKQTKDQVGLNYAERQENLSGSIKLVDKNLVKDKSILLVDDVITTGATANVCAEVLNKNGSKQVFVLSFASVSPKISLEKIDETQQKQKK